MDPLSQAVVGAGFSACCADKRYVRPAIIAGIVGGLLADADILIRSTTDPLLAVEYHRHFTHALAFVPIGGLVAALLCWPVLRFGLSFALIYLFATIGYATHGLLDSMTNYGTHLLWPFSNRRESWSIISIVDPVFTLTLLALCAVAYHRQAQGFARAAVVFALVYWSLGYIQRERATEAMLALAESRGHTPIRYEVKPAFANIIVWRAQYEYKGTYYIDAVRAMPFTLAKWYEGGRAPAFDMATAYPQLSHDSQAYKDYRRFAFFSDGWVSALNPEKTLLGDMRFATLPNSVQPLWGITLNPNIPQAHVNFSAFSQDRRASFGVLCNMITGRDSLATVKPQE